MSALVTRRPARWTRFVRTYGWRAYALPVLSILTVVVLLQGVPAQSPPRSNAARTGATADRLSNGRQVEGTVAAGFAAADTPAPVVLNRGTESTSCTGNQYHKLVIVSLSKQQLWACQGQRQVNTTVVTTGRSLHHDQTPVGSWRVQAKERNRYLVGADYKDYVKYWVPFNGDFGFHDASWQTMAFGSQDYKQRGSHGCVHLPTPMMRWLYHWTSVDSTVVNIEA